MPSISNINSISLLRTNPKLSTNAKLLVDSNYNMFIESIDADFSLKNERFKNFRIDSKSSWDFDLAKFWDSTFATQQLKFKVGKEKSDDFVQSKLQDQFETLYMAGARELPSTHYEEQNSYLAPLWLQGEIPKGFVIFKIPGASSIDKSVISRYNINVEDLNDYISGIRGNLFNRPEDYKLLGFNKTFSLEKEFFVNEILDNCEIIKYFDLSIDSPLGRYLRNYNRKLGLSPLDINLKKGETFAFKGISLDQGGIITKREDLYKELVETDRIILEENNIITNGWSRNNMACPNIINLEFAFDDINAGDFEINRYFGMYVDLEITAFTKVSSINKNEVTLNLRETRTTFDYDTDKLELVDVMPSQKDIDNPIIPFIRKNNDYAKIRNKSNFIHDRINDRLTYNVTNFNIDFTDDYDFINNLPVKIFDNSAGISSFRFTFTETPKHGDAFVLGITGKNSYEITWKFPDLDDLQDEYVIYFDTIAESLINEFSLLDKDEIRAGGIPTFDIIRLDDHVNWELNNNPNYIQGSNDFSLDNPFVFRITKEEILTNKDTSSNKFTKMSIKIKDFFSNMFEYIYLQRYPFIISSNDRRPIIEVDKDAVRIVDFLGLSPRIIARQINFRNTFPIDFKYTVGDNIYEKIFIGIDSDDIPESTYDEYYFSVRGNDQIIYNNLRNCLNQTVGKSWNAVLVDDVEGEFIITARASGALFNKMVFGTYLKNKSSIIPDDRFYIKNNPKYYFNLYNEVELEDINKLQLFNFTGGSDNPGAVIGVPANVAGLFRELNEKNLYIRGENYVNGALDYLQVIDIGNWIYEPTFNAENDIKKFNNLDEFVILYVNPKFNIHYNTDFNVSLYKNKSDVIGYFSFYEIKDFDFDTISSEYDTSLEKNREGLFFTARNVENPFNILNTPPAKYDLVLEKEFENLIRLDSIYVKTADDTEISLGLATVPQYVDGTEVPVPDDRPFLPNELDFEYVYNKINTLQFDTFSKFDYDSIKNLSITELINDTHINETDLLLSFVISSDEQNMTAIVSDTVLEKFELIQDIFNTPKNFRWFGDFSRLESETFGGRIELGTELEKDSQKASPQLAKKWYEFSKDGRFVIKNEYEKEQINLYQNIYDISGNLLESNFIKVIKDGIDLQGSKLHLYELPIYQQGKDILYERILVILTNEYISIYTITDDVQKYLDEGEIITVLNEFKYNGTDRISISDIDSDKFINSTINFTFNVNSNSIIGYLIVGNKEQLTNILEDDDPNPTGILKTFKLDSGFNITDNGVFNYDRNYKKLGGKVWINESGNLLLSTCIHENKEQLVQLVREDLITNTIKKYVIEKEFFILKGRSDVNDSLSDIGTFFHNPVNESQLKPYDLKSIYKSDTSLNTISNSLQLIGMPLRAVDRQFNDFSFIKNSLTTGNNREISVSYYEVITNSEFLTEALTINDLPTSISNPVLVHSTYSEEKYIKPFYKTIKLPDPTLTEIDPDTNEPIRVLSDYKFITNPTLRGNNGENGSIYYYKQDINGVPEDLSIFNYRDTSSFIQGINTQKFGNKLKVFSVEDDTLAEPIYFLYSSAPEFNEGVGKIYSLIYNYPDGQFESYNQGNITAEDFNYREFGYDFEVTDKGEYAVVLSKGKIEVFKGEVVTRVSGGDVVFDRFRFNKINSLGIKNSTLDNASLIYDGVREQVDTLGNVLGNYHIFRYVLLNDDNPSDKKWTLGRIKINTLTGESLNYTQDISVRSGLINLSTYQSADGYNNIIESTNEIAITSYYKDGTNIVSKTSLFKQFDRLNNEQEFEPDLESEYSNNIIEKDLSTLLNDYPEQSTTILDNSRYLNVIYKANGILVEETTLEEAYVDSCIINLDINTTEVLLNKEVNGEIFDYYITKNLTTEYKEKTVSIDYDTTTNRVIYFLEEDIKFVDINNSVFEDVNRDQSEDVEVEVQYDGVLISNNNNIILPNPEISTTVFGESFDFDYRNRIFAISNANLSNGQTQAVGKINIYSFDGNTFQLVDFLNRGIYSKDNNLNVPKNDIRLGMKVKLSDNLLKAFVTQNYEYDEELGFNSYLAQYLNIFNVKARVDFIDFNKNTTIELRDYSINKDETIYLESKLITDNRTERIGYTKGVDYFRVNITDYDTIYGNGKNYVYIRYNYNLIGFDNKTPITDSNGEEVQGESISIFTKYNGEWSEYSFIDYDINKTTDYELLDHHFDWMENNIIELYLQDGEYLTRVYDLTLIEDEIGITFTHTVENLYFIAKARSQFFEESDKKVNDSLPIHLTFHPTRIHSFFDPELGLSLVIAGDKVDRNDEYKGIHAQYYVFGRTPEGILAIDTILDVNVNLETRYVLKDAKIYLGEVFIGYSLINQTLLKDALDTDPTTGINIYFNQVDNNTGKNKFFNYVEYNIFFTKLETVNDNEKLITFYDEFDINGQFIKVVYDTEAHLYNRIGIDEEAINVPESVIEFFNDFQSTFKLLGTLGKDSPEDINITPGTNEERQLLLLSFVNTEYDRLRENNLVGTANLNKTAPFINKWVYSFSVNTINKDYLFNTSYAFGYNNFSPSPVSGGSKALDFTNDYYLFGTYPIEGELPEDYFNDEFQVERIFFDDKYFDKYFVKNSEANNKYYNTKSFSFITGGTNNISPSTIFKGVKYNLINKRVSIDGTINEYTSNDFNKYRFTNVLSVRQADKDNSEFKIVRAIVKDDRQKCFVFNTIVYLDDNRVLQRDSSGNIIRNNYIKYSQYALKDKLNTLGNIVDLNSGKFPDLLNYNILNGNVVLRNKGDLDIVKDILTVNDTSGLRFTVDSIEDDDLDRYIVEMSMIKKQSTLENIKIDVNSIKIIDRGPDLLENIEYRWFDSNLDRVEQDKFRQIITDILAKLSNTKILRSRVNVFYIGSGINAYKNLSDKLSFSKFEEDVRLGKVNYISILQDSSILFNENADFKLKVIPEYPILKVRELNVKELEELPVSFTSNNTTFGYELFKEGKVAIPMSRFPGTYSPKFRDCIKFNSILDKEFYRNNVDNVNKFEHEFHENEYRESLFFNLFRGKNIIFTIDKSAGKVKNHFYHKVNRTEPFSIIENTNSTTFKPVYPLIGETPIDYRDVQIFQSRFDPGFYLENVSKIDGNLINGTLSPSNKPWYLNSALVKYQDEIELTTDISDRDFEILIDRDIILDEAIDNIRLNEGSQDIVIDFNLKRKIIEHIKNTKIRDYFKVILLEGLDFDLQEFNEFIDNYIENSLMPRYFIKDVELYVLENDVQNGVEIETAVLNDLDVINIKSGNAGYKKVNVSTIKSQNNNFDFRLIYNKTNKTYYKFFISAKIKVI